MSKYTIADVETKLSKGIWKVTFMKKGGEIRTITCTRDWEWLNDENICDEMEFIPPHGGTCYNTLTKVWAIDSYKKDGSYDYNMNDWRSLNPEKVISMEEYSYTDDDLIVEEQD